MNVSVGRKWEAFVAEAVETGRYSSASEVVREGLRLVEEREAKLKGLKEMVAASIAGGRATTDEELGEELEEHFELLKKQGF